jgi:prevent-host-death family protein
MLCYGVPGGGPGSRRAIRLDRMTKSVGVHEAKTHLSRLLEQVATGEEVEITNRGRVVARLVPADRRPRFGFARSSVVIADDFDAPLPEDVIAAFER